MTFSFCRVSNHNDIETLDDSLSNRWIRVPLYLHYTTIVLSWYRD